MMLIMAEPPTFSPSLQRVLQTPGNSAVNETHAPYSEGATADMALFNIKKKKWIGFGAGW